jgi:hypothetical protein
VTRLADAPVPVRECLGAYEAFRRLGYLPEEIFFGIASDGVFMQLRHAGLKFTAAFEWPGMPDAAEVDRLWRAGAIAWNGGATEAERQELWEGCRVRNNSADFVLAMADRGMPVTSESVVASRRAVH